MSFRESIKQDIGAVFMCTDEFAEEHIWNGTRIVCVIDVDTELKRKNNNVLDISWDNNREEINVFVPVMQLAQKPRVNGEILLDGNSYRVMNVDEDMGLYMIALTAQTARYL